MNLALNQSTANLLTSYANRPSHALLLHGLVGVGLFTIAKDLAKRSHKQADIITLEADTKHKIGIESINELRQKLKLSRASQPLVVIIDEADKLTKAAQNKLLKSLEEPVEGVYFILTSHNIHGLLATVRSRATKLEAKPLDQADSQSFLKQFSNLSEPKRQQIGFLASGLPAEIQRLSQDEDYFSHQSGLIKDAKTLLSSSTYEGLTIITSYQNRQSAIELVKVLQNLIKFIVLDQGDGTKARHIPIIEKTLDNLSRNGHVKTQLASLITNLN